MKSTNQHSLAHYIQNHILHTEFFRTYSTHFWTYWQNLLVLCAFGMHVGGATHSSHLFQPIEFRMKTKHLTHTKHLWIVDIWIILTVLLSMFILTWNLEAASPALLETLSSLQLLDDNLCNIMNSKAEVTKGLKNRQMLLTTKHKIMPTIELI